MKYCLALLRMRFEVGYRQLATQQADRDVTLRLLTKFKADLSALSKAVNDRHKSHISC